MLPGTRIAAPPLRSPDSRLLVPPLVVVQDELLPALAHHDSAAVEAAGQARLQLPQRVHRRPRHAKVVGGRSGLHVPIPGLRAKEAAFPRRFANSETTEEGRREGQQVFFVSIYPRGFDRCRLRLSRNECS